MPWHRRIRRAAALAGVPMLAALLVVLAAAAPALACQEDVAQATRRLAELKRQVPRALRDDRARVTALLQDAGQTLAEARKDCIAATNFAERALASAKVAAARASMAAADALIPAR